VAGVPSAAGWRGPGRPAGGGVGVAGYGPGVTSIDAVVIAAAAVGALAFWWYCIGVVGRVAERFGEDPARWRVLMLPFSVFGPFVAWYILSRRNGGGSGGRVA
jgi:hypothetical protein